MANNEATVVNEAAQKKYLTFGKKLAYGSGDFGSNFFYMLISSFMMLYLGDYIGLDLGIIGTLMMISRLLDGITDVIFGNLIDKTNSKMGKARPWMFYSGFPLAISMILLFSIPTGMGDTAKYAYFFIIYTLANAFFYTANNISYSSLLAFITKNDAERVSLGSFRYIMAVAAAVVVSSITTILVGKFGGDAAAWRTVAIIYAVIVLIFNTIASLSNKELPADEDETAAIGDDAGSTPKSGISFGKSLKIVFSNKYYLLLLMVYLLFYCSSGVASAVSAFYFTYVIGNASLMGVVSMSSFVMIVGLIINPMLVKRFGMYKVNLGSYIICTILAALTIPVANAGNLTGLTAMAFIKAIAMGPLMGSLNALVAEVSRNAFLKSDCHVEGMMFSCSSIGIKVGTGIGTAVAGWLLTVGGYVSGAASQTEGAVSMIKFCYATLPFFLTALVTVCLWRLNVEKANKELEASKN